MLVMAKVERSPHLTSSQDKPNTQLQITKELLEGFLYGKKKARLVHVQSKEKPNRKRKCDSVEDECSRKLQSLWCEECCKHIQGECPIHQSSQPKLTYAVGSFPPEVRLCTSTIPEYMYGACAAKPMPRGTWIGPYEGRRIYSTQSPTNQDNAYVWEIYEKGQFSHFIDGSDESISSWMRFIRCARHKTEQNMSVIQYGKNIYYYAIRNIEIGEEMLVWYHESYYQFWGVPLMLTRELDAEKGPPVPQGKAQPMQMKVAQTSPPNQHVINSSPASHSLHAQAVTSPQSVKQSNSPKSLAIPQENGVHKSFYFLKQITESTSISSKRYLPPSELPYPPVSPQIPSKTVLPDSSISPAAQHPSPGVFTYPPVPRPYLPSNVSAPYPALSNGSTPYPPLSKGGIPYPPPARKAMQYPPMSPQFAYPPQPRYPPTSPGTILCQPASMLSKYDARSSQLSPVFQMAPQPPFLEKQRPISHAVIPLQNIQIPPKVQNSPNVQVAPHTHIPPNSQISPHTHMPPNGQISPHTHMPPNGQISPHTHMPSNGQISPHAQIPSNGQISPHNHILPNGQISPHAQIPPITRTSPTARSPGSSALSRNPQIPTSYQIPQQLSPGSKIQDTSSHSPRANQQTINHSPRAEQHPTNHSPRAEQQPTIPSPREQAIRAYYETDNYTGSTVVTVDRSSASSETDQWAKADVKENMPLGGTRDIDVIENRFKNSKHPQSLKSSPLQNLTPSIHNKRQFSEQSPEKQHNQMSLTAKDQEISWKCGQCEQMFAQQVTLRMHVCLKPPDNPFHCGHCTDTFATSFELREHVETHNNDRPFKCGFCARSFAGATTLGNHMRTHTGQRPYECKVCGQTFAIATQLSRHLKPPGECGLKQKEANGYNQNVDIAVEQ